MDHGGLVYGRKFYMKGTPTQQQLLSEQGFNPTDHLKNKVRPSPGHQLYKLLPAHSRLCHRARLCTRRRAALLWPEIPGTW